MKRLEEMAAEGNPAVQMVLPMAEVVGWLRDGVGELIRRAGLQLIELLMEEEVRQLVGQRSQPQAERTANRWGTERGYCVVMGQKVPHRAAASSFDRRSGDPVGQLRDVPSRGAVNRDGVGETHARSEHRGNMARQYESSAQRTAGEERDQRTFHRSEPDQTEGTDGAAVGEKEVLRAAC